MTQSHQLHQPARSLLRKTLVVYWPLIFNDLDSGTIKASFNGRKYRLVSSSVVERGARSSDHTDTAHRQNDLDHFLLAGELLDLLYDEIANALAFLWRRSHQGYRWVVLEEFTILVRLGHRLSRSKVNLQKQLLVCDPALQSQHRHTISVAPTLIM